MDSEELSIGGIAGLTVDFLVIAVPILLTVAVAAVVTVTLLPEFSIAVVGAAVILAAVRWLNCRDDEYRAKRYSQVPP